MKENKLKFFPQHDQMDCGPACLAMISSYYGKDFGLQYLRNKSFITREGVSLLGISEASKKIGFSDISAKLNADDFDNGLLPCILHWNQNHFVVLYKISKNANLLGRIIIEHRFIIMVNQLLTVHRYNPEDCYRYFLEHYKDLVQRIPQYLIASYVGVKPQSLSRIRKRIY